MLFGEVQIPFESARTVILCQQSIDVDPAPTDREAAAAGQDFEPLRGLDRHDCRAKRVERARLQTPAELCNELVPVCVGQGRPCCSRTPR